MPARVARNARCPCGSGKSYKSCCLGTEPVPQLSSGEGARVFCLLLLGGAVLRLLPLVFGIESTDIGLYRQQAAPVLEGKNVYTATRSVFPYTPVSMFYPALGTRVSEVLPLPFHAVMKLVAVLSDLAIVAALYGFGRRLVAEKRALLAAGFYALSPVGILVASFHGNVMPFVSLLTLLAYLHLSIDPEERWRGSALLLGLAVGWRTFPVLLLPFFLAALPGARRRLLFSAYALLPTALATVPFLALAPREVLREMAGYSGWGIHHGAFGVLRADYLLSLGWVTWANPDHWKSFFGSSKVAYLVAYALVVVTARRRSLLSSILVVYLLFYAVYASVASQYLVWVLPFLALVSPAGAFWAYSAAATYALVVFYWTFFPDILFGALTWPRTEVSSLLWHYRTAEVLFTLVVVSILGGLLMGKVSPLRPGRTGGAGRIPCLG